MKVQKSVFESNSLADGLFFKTYLNDVKNLLKYEGFKNANIQPETSLADDLKLHHNDYYFLKLDIEKMISSEVDIDEIYNCVRVTDVVRLLITKMGSFYHNNFQHSR